MPTIKELEALLVSCEEEMLFWRHAHRDADKRVRELDAEVAALKAERDADRRREYGYSQQTVDALTAERDRLKVRITELEAWKAAVMNWKDKCGLFQNRTIARVG